MACIPQSILALFPSIFVPLVDAFVTARVVPSMHLIEYLATLFSRRDADCWDERRELSFGICVLVPFLAFVVDDEPVNVYYFLVDCQTGIVLGRVVPINKHNFVSVLDCIRHFQHKETKSVWDRFHGPPDFYVMAKMGSLRMLVIDNLRVISRACLYLQCYVLTYLWLMNTDRDGFFIKIN